MKIKNLWVLLLAVCMMLVLCSCFAAAPEQSEDQPGSSQAADPTEAPSSALNFGLQPAPAPDFDSPATGSDTNKLYTIVGDYAYELDPTTLQAVGEPLDPITHEPVSNPVLEGSNPSTPNNPQNTEPPAASTPPVQSEPPASPAPSATPDTSLPNTGEFLEDD